MEDDLFELRNVVCDFYLEPANDFSVLKYGRRRVKPGEVSPSLGVMRIFGIAPDGTKCCAHVHGFLPYVIFRTKSRATDELRTHFTSLVAEVVSQSPFGRSILASGGEAIYGIFDERGTSMYGYCKSEYFIRVVFYDPRIAKLCTYVFQKEFSTSKSAAYLQPFNAHYNVVLQFFIDYSLHGMDMVYIRRRYSRQQSSDQPPSRCFRGIELRSPLRPIANTALEFDIFTDDIMNSDIVRKSPHKLSGLAFIWEEERRRRELLGVDFQVPTPGDVGLLAVWTAHEESLKEELRGLLKQAQRKESSQRSRSQSAPLGQLSQAVINDLRVTTGHEPQPLNFPGKLDSHVDGQAVNAWRDLWGEYNDDDRLEGESDEQSFGTTLYAAYITLRGEDGIEKKALLIVGDQRTVTAGDAYKGSLAPYRPFITMNDHTRREEARRLLAENDSLPQIPVSPKYPDQTKKVHSIFVNNILCGLFAVAGPKYDKDIIIKKKIDDSDVIRTVGRTIFGTKFNAGIHAFVIVALKRSEKIYLIYPCTYELCGRECDQIFHSTLVTSNHFCIGRGCPAIYNRLDDGVMYEVYTYHELQVFLKENFREAHKYDTQTTSSYFSGRIIFLHSSEDLLIEYNW